MSRLAARVLALAAVATLAGSGGPALAAGIAASVPGDSITYVTDPELASTPIQAFHQQGGPTLLLSDAPEDVPGPGILYQDDVNGPFRLFFDHVAATASGAPLAFTVLATNRGTAAVTITLTRVGYAGPSENYIATGQAAQRAWMTSSLSTALVVPPGQTSYLLPQVPSWTARAQQDVTGIIDGTADADVVLSVVAESTPAASLQGLTILPAPLDPTGFALRGTFPQADVTLQAQADGAFQHLDMAQPTDYLRGYSAVDNLAPAEDYGNYGVLYDVRVMVMGNAGRLAAVFDPQGGPFAGAGLIGTGFGPGTAVDLPSGGTFARSALASILLGQFTLVRNASLLLRFQWMPPAGSYLPASLILSPY